MMTDTVFALINSRRQAGRTRKQVQEMLVEVDRLSSQAQVAASCHLLSDTLWQELTRRANAALDQAKASCDLVGISFEQLLTEHIRRKLRYSKMRRTS
jgi:hypothetical protein